MGWPDMATRGDERLEMIEGRDREKRVAAR